VLALAECSVVERLAARCRCGHPAYFTERTHYVEGLVVVGGEELYRPSCAACHHVPQYSPLSDTEYSP
jgi:thymidine kinase